MERINKTNLMKMTKAELVELVLDTINSADEEYGKTIAALETKLMKKEKELEVFRGKGKVGYGAKKNPYVK